MIIEDWQKSDEKYVVTHAAEHVLHCTKNNSCVTVTGSSGIGKTATIRHVALQMEKDDYYIVPIKDPCDVIKSYQPGRKTLCVIDDCCGRYLISQTDFEKWTKDIDDINLLLEKSCTKLIIGCRLLVYQDQQFKALPLFKSCECNLQSQQLRLSQTERKAIARQYLKEDAIKIPSEDRFDCFPLLCSLYERNPELDIQKLFENPFSVYKTELNRMNLIGAHSKRCVLALIVMFNNKLCEKWLNDDIEKEIISVIDKTCDACNLNRGTSRCLLRNELDSLINTFLRKHDNVYSTIHDKLFDFMSYYFGKHILSCLIKNADCCFIRERFLFSEPKDNDFFIIVPEDYHQKYMDRLLEDWYNGEVVNVFCNINMKDKMFQESFLCKIKSRDIQCQMHLANMVDKYNNDTVLYQICFHGNAKYVQWCFDHNVDPNITSRPDNFSPLYIACQENHLDIVRILLERKEDINKCRNTGATPLYIACQNGHSKIVDMLLKDNADINKCKETGATPLFIACQNGRTEIVDMLLNNKADIDKWRNDGASPLHIACQKGHTEIVEMLLNNKADIDKCMNNGASSLFIACQEGQTEILDMLLKTQADIDKCSNDGASPLYIACQHNHTELLDMLLNNKADINKCINDGASPLLIACQKGHTEIVNMLLNNNADVNKCANDGASPLFIACQKGHTEIVNKVLNYKADVDKCEETCDIPLCIACHEGHTEKEDMLLNNKADMLLNNKADIDKCMNDDTSPLHIACQQGNTEIVEMLLNSKADIDKCTNDGGSPLFIACKEGHTEIVYMLLNNNADMNKCCNDGASPIVIAHQNGHTKIIDILSNKQGSKKSNNDSQSPFHRAV